MSILGSIGSKIKELKDSLGDITLSNLPDTEPGVHNESILKYDCIIQCMEGSCLAGAGSGTEFLDGVVDGGVADTIHIEILDLDGGHA